MDNNDEEAMKMLTVGTEILAEKEFELRHQHALCEHVEYFLSIPAQ